MSQKLKRWAGRIFMAALVTLFVFAFAYSLPADFALLAAIDMATYVDALIGVYVVARISRLRPILEYLKIRIVQRFPKRQPKRAQKPRISADNDDHPALTRSIVAPTAWSFSSSRS